MRLIDADALIEVLEAHKKDCEDAYKNPGGNGWEYMRQAYVTAIGEVKIQENAQLPKLNRQIDSDMVAENIVYHILAKVAKIYGSRIDNKTTREFIKYTKDKIELVKNLSK